MVIDNKFDLKQDVYLSTCIDQKIRIVTGIIVHVDGITYQLTSGTEVTEHYDYEISETKNVLIE